MNPLPKIYLVMNENPSKGCSGNLICGIFDNEEGAIKACGDRYTYYGTFILNEHINELRKSGSANWTHPIKTKVSEAGGERSDP